MKTGTKAGIIAGAVIGGLLLTGVTIGIATSVKKDHNENLELWVPWKEDGSYQTSSLRYVVDEYNSTHNGLDVELHFVEGYGAAGTAFKKDIDAGERGIENLPDMYIDYAGATSILSSYQSEHNYALDLSQGENAVDPNWVISSIRDSQSKIEGVDKDGLYVLPLSMSSELQVINAPAFVMMLHNFQEKGGTVIVNEGKITNQIADAAGGEQDGLVVSTKYNKDGMESNLDNAYNIEDEIYKAEETPIVKNGNFKWDIKNSLDIVYETISNEDKDAFNKLWNPVNDVTGKTVTINDKTFTDYEEMFSIANQLMSVYDFSGKASDLFTHAIVGMDSVPNFMSATQTMQGHGESSLDSDGKFTFDSFDGADGSASAKNSFNVLKDGVVTGAVRVKGTDAADGSYTSDLLKTHEAVISIGSTAGAAYNFDYDTNKDGSENEGSLNRGEAVMLTAPSTMGTSGKIQTFTQQGPSIGAIDRSSNSKHSDKYTERENQSKEFLSWIMNPDTVIQDSYGVDMSPATYMTYQSGYITGSTSVVTDDKSSEFESKILNSDKDGLNTRVINSGYWDGNVYKQDTSDKYKIGASIAYSTIDATSKGAQFQDEAFGLYSDTYRNNFGNEFKNMRDTITSGKTYDITADAWLKGLIDEAASNGWITKSLKNNEVFVSNKS